MFPLTFFPKEVRTLLSNKYLFVSCKVSEALNKPADRIKISNLFYSKWGAPPPQGEALARVE